MSFTPEKDDNEEGNAIDDDQTNGAKDKQTEHQAVARDEEQAPIEVGATMTVGYHREKVIP